MPSKPAETALLSTKRACSRAESWKQRPAGLRDMRNRPQAGAGEFCDFCRGKVTHDKIPRYVRSVPPFPITIMGKFQRYILRDQVAGEIGHRRDACRAVRGHLVRHKRLNLRVL